MLENIFKVFDIFKDFFKKFYCVGDIKFLDMFLKVVIIGIRRFIFYSK